MTGWESLGSRALPDSAPADALVALAGGVLKPRECSGLRDVQALGPRWAHARVAVSELQLFRGEYGGDGLRAGDAVLLADSERGVVHPPARVLDLDPDPASWPEEGNLLVQASVLMDRAREPLAVADLPALLGEAATWATGAARAELRASLLDLWGLDLTCPVCGGRGGPIGYGMRLPSGPTADPDEELILGGCVIESFMHRYACRYCHARWGGAPRFADPTLLGLAVAGGVVRAEDMDDGWSTPVALRWLNTLLDGAADLLDGWTPCRTFTEFDSRYGRTVGVDLARGDDRLELEYNPDGSRVSGWDLGSDAEGEPPPVSFTLTPVGPTAARALAEAGLYTANRGKDVIVLGWNPRKWDAWDPPYDQWVAATGDGQTLTGRWSVARRRHIAPGTEVFLLLQGRDHGLVGHGVTTDWPAPGPHYSDPTRSTQYVTVQWDRLLPLDAAVPREVLETEAPGMNWRAIYSSGWPVPDHATADLRALWRREAG